MTPHQRRNRIKELRERAERMEASVSSTDGPSSQHWVSPERRSHYMNLAFKDRQEAERLERDANLTSADVSTSESFPRGV